MSSNRKQRVNNPDADLSTEDAKAQAKIELKASRAQRRSAHEHRLMPLRGRAMGSVRAFPSATPEPTDLTFLPSHLHRAMMLFKLRVIDLTRLFGHTRFTVNKWLNGSVIIPLGVAQYFQLRTNELIRAYAHGVGFGLISDVDHRIQSGATAAQRARLQDAFNKSQAPGPEAQP